jgi:hypothetical protein
LGVGLSVCALFVWELEGWYGGRLWGLWKSLEVGVSAGYEEYGVGCGRQCLV